ncbi:MAG: ARMT1-like domain-containing protein [Firmicutes bacterium]|nr:ARMT1-like domain-containing protein [Bacillota bacterium]
MSIPVTSECYVCHLRRSVETARALGGEEAATAFARELMGQYLTAPEGVGSPWFGPGVTELLKKHCGLKGDRFREEKERSNRFVLERLEDIRRRIRAAEDPLYAGAQMAVLGNYIDFSALQGEVSFEKLDNMLDDAAQIRLDPEAYGALRSDLERGGRLLYLTDNAGEIGFDRLLAEEIHRAYPRMEITFCVGGGPAANDATREDAAAVGIPFPVIDNGNTVAGTQPELLGAEAREALAQADVILSKGQGNVETLYGCGWNVYYLFLIKCPLFVKLFGQPKLTPMLLRDGTPLH